MMIKTSTVVVVCIGLLFSACCEKPKTLIKTEYVKTQCPKLQTYDVNKTVVTPLHLQYEVIKNGK